MLDGLAELDGQVPKVFLGRCDQNPKLIFPGSDDCADLYDYAVFTGLATFRRKIADFTLRIAAEQVIG